MIIAMIFPSMNQPDKVIRTSSRANAAQPRAVDERQPPDQAPQQRWIYEWIYNHLVMTNI